MALAAYRASTALGKDVNDLDDAEFGDYFSGEEIAAMGSINVTGTVRAYVEKMDRNKEAHYRNHEYGENNRCLTDEQFRVRFGPPPWELLNEILRVVLDARYEFEAQVLSNIAGYDGKLIRVEDGKVVDPVWLSSGEKVLMWLCLSMYATDTRSGAEPWKLLLLDEPDSALHPQIIQKLHMVLERIANAFECGIIFTTHSPTSVALFNAGPIWQISEQSIVVVDKDVAIAELLVGLDQISIHYTKCKQVYVESHKDADIYSAMFSYLRRWDSGVSKHIALSFIPAATKLARENITNLLKAHFGEPDPQRTEAFVQALNGQGDCMQVIGAVESLNAHDGLPVHGIIDWDLRNTPIGRIRILGEGLFYNIESAVLNPLTLGVYLLQNFPGNVRAEDFGLANGFDLVTLYTDSSHWQAVADGVMRRVLGVRDVNCDLECPFLSGGRVRLDQNYTHKNGHELEQQLKQPSVFPFLNGIRRPGLMMDVIQKVVHASKGRMMPKAFIDLFVAIQAQA